MADLVCPNCWRYFANADSCPFCRVGLITPPVQEWESRATAVSNPQADARLEAALSAAGPPSLKKAARAGDFAIIGAAVVVIEGALLTWVLGSWVWLCLFAVSNFFLIGGLTYRRALLLLLTQLASTAAWDTVLIIRPILGLTDWERGLIALIFAIPLIPTAVFVREVGRVGARLAAYASYKRD